MVSPAQLSVLRMIPVARRISRLDRDRLAVFRLLNSRRGWDDRHTPVEDALWALDQIAERLGSLPICLVGHSLGGRAALLAAGRGKVRGVVALNAWVLPGDAPRGLTDQQLLFVHGTNDRIASPRSASMLAARLQYAVPVRFEWVRGGKHAMLRHGRAFSTLTVDFVDRLLLEAYGDETASERP